MKQIQLENGQSYRYKIFGWYSIGLPEIRVEYYNEKLQDWVNCWNYKTRDHIRRMLAETTPDEQKRGRE